MDMTFLNVLLPMMFEGLKLTILIAVVGITIGFLIGSSVDTCFSRNIK